MVKWKFCATEYQVFGSVLSPQVAGGSLHTGVSWNGMDIHATVDVLDQDWFCFDIDSLCLITGGIKKPTWASDLGGQKGLQWQAGTTSFKDAVVYPLQLGTVRRNAAAAATGLTA